MEMQKQICMQSYALVKWNKTIFKNTYLYILQPDHFEVIFAKNLAFAFSSCLSYNPNTKRKKVRMPRKGKLKTKCNDLQIP